MMQYSLGHIVLNAKDEEAMMAFYMDVLMLRPERLEEYRAGKAPFPSVRLNADAIIDIFPERMWRDAARPGDGVENMNHFCLVVSDKQQFETLFQRLHARHIDIKEGPAPRWGAHGMGTSVYFQDPEGNLIELRHYDEAV